MLRTISDPTKLKILLLLHQVKEIAVSDITLTLGTSQSAASHALADLKKLHLVQSHRCGQLTCYSLVTDSKKQKLVTFLNKFL